MITIDYLTLFSVIAGLGDHNYCRNADDDQRPWCYYSNPATGALEGWTYCAVTECPARPVQPAARTEAPPPPPTQAPGPTRAPTRISE